MIDIRQELLTVPEAATALDVSERTVWRLLKKEKLASTNITGVGCFRITRKSVEQYIQELIDQAPYTK